MVDINARYVKIAKDIASKIVSGEFPEGSILKGRSLLASIYNVSPETIRKSVQLLANEKILFVKHGVGVFIDSKALAKKYLDTFPNQKEVDKTSSKIEEIIKESKRLQEELDKEVSKHLEDYKFNASASIPISEVKIDYDSWIINKTLGETNFWNYTEATIVAIKRLDGMVLYSPGPDIPLNKLDTLYFVCKDELSYERVLAFLEYGIEEE